MTDPIKHLNKVSGRRFFSHNTEPEQGREEGGEEEREGGEGDLYTSSQVM